METREDGISNDEVFMEGVEYRIAECLYGVVEKATESVYFY